MSSTLAIGPVAGAVAPGWEPVRDAFAKNFEARDEVGAAVCVYHHGRPVVDLCGGVADTATSRPWTDDTIVLVYSMTKGVSAVCANLLVERGALDPDAPVASYWPEFAAKGKGDIPVKWVLSHQAGLAVIEADVTLEHALSWTPVVDALAAQPPNWEPGTAHGYHLRSYGWLVGEIVRRIDGRTIGRFFADEIAAPLGLDFWIGLPESEEPRVAMLVPPPVEFRELMRTLPDTMLLARATTGPSGLFNYDEMWNRRELRACELPSSNGVGNARAVAKLYASLIGEVDGRRTLRAETVARATECLARGPDAVILTETAFGLGFMLGPTLPTPCGPRAFGHGGAGGSVSFADPDAGLAFAYVMNDLRFDMDGDPRGESLARAAYRCLAGLG
jgi:CubicO group peptidase (beta-lactamase class C family)